MPVHSCSRTHEPSGSDGRPTSVKNRVGVELGLAHAHHALGNAPGARRHVEELRRLAPQLRGKGASREDIVAVFARQAELEDPD